MNSSFSTITELLMTTIEDRNSSGGDIIAHSTRPSFFEIYLLENTESIFKPALRHLYNAFYNPSSHLDDEMAENFFNIFYISTFGFLEMKSLFSPFRSSTLGESFYGFQRQNKAIDYKTDTETGTAKLFRYQKLLSLIYSLVLPIFFEKLKYLLKKWHQKMLEEEDCNGDNAVYHDGNCLYTLANSLGNGIQMFKRCTVIFFANHLEKFEFLYDLYSSYFKFAYLLHFSDYHNPLFAWLQITLVKSNIRKKGKTPEISTFIITLAVLTLKTMQWIHSTENSESSNIRDYFKKPAQLPIFPKAPQIAKGGLIPPSDKLSSKVCAICKETRKNPVATSSGYVFCYLCIVPIIRDKKHCPISHLPCSEQDLVRIYDSGT